LEKFEGKMYGRSKSNRRIILNLFMNNMLGCVVGCSKLWTVKADCRTDTFFCGGFIMPYYEIRYP
jgi:hypothetical protein